MSGQGFREDRERLVADAKLGRELVAVLSEVAGDGGTSEGAVECCKRILHERYDLQAKVDFEASHGRQRRDNEIIARLAKERDDCRRELMTLDEDYEKTKRRLSVATSRGDQLANALHIEQGAADTRRRMIREEAEGVKAEFADMEPDEAARYLTFWRAAAMRWVEWADKLVQHPDPLTMYGHDGLREAIGLELGLMRARELGLLTQAVEANRKLRVAVACLEALHEPPADSRQDGINHDMLKACLKAVKS